MSNIEKLNYPAFNAAAKTLRELGHVVTNPAENPVPPCGTWLGYMRMSLRQIADVEAVVLMPGYWHSRGASIEKDLAEGLGMPVYLLQYCSEIPV